MTKPILHIYLLFAISLCFGIFDDPGAEAHSMGAGGIVTHTEGADAIFGNPAGLGLGGLHNNERTDLMATTHYSNYWGLAELSFVGVGAGWRSRYGNIGISYRNFGEPDLYAENRFALAYSNRVWKKISLGGRMIYGNIDMGSHGSVNTSIFDIGAKWEFSERIGVSFLWQNFMRTNIDINGEKIEIDSPISIALEIAPIEWAKIIMDVQTYDESKLRLKIGQNIYLGNILAVNMGISGKPNKFYFGINAEKYDLTLSYSASIHSELGMTNNIVLKYD